MINQALASNQTSPADPLEARELRLTIKINAFERDLIATLARRDGSKNFSETVRRLLVQHAKEEGIL